MIDTDYLEQEILKRREKAQGRELSKEETEGLATLMGLLAQQLEQTISKEERWIQ